MDWKGNEKILLLIGCGCVFFLFTAAITGALLWIYLQKHPQSFFHFPQHQIEAPTPDEHWNPGKAQNANYIAAIKARTDVLKFFEGPLDLQPDQKRNYRYSFDRNQSRGIYWEL